MYNQSTGTAFITLITYDFTLILQDLIDFVLFNLMGHSSRELRVNRFRKSIWKFYSKEDVTT